LDLIAMLAPTIVYDLDGTLADTAEDLVATLNHLLGREGLAPLPVESAGSLLGAGARALIVRGFAAAGRSLDSQEIEALFADYLTYYSAHIQASTRRWRPSRALAGARRSAPTRSKAWPGS
jgi:phosphoglycolate phosphatase